MTERKPLMISLYDLLGTIENDKALYKYVEFGNEIFVWNGRNYVNPVNDDDLICDVDFADCKKPMIKILSYIYCTGTCEETDDEEECINDSMPAYVTEDVAKED